MVVSRSRVMTRANSPPMVVDQKEDLLVANYAHRELQLSAKSGPKETLKKTS
ncbi:hypothetical protein ALP90_02257 [Pseudomonas amygdali pv. ulmi]|uniref:Uncharacterized protein n=1 Tax=Pseudomonas amygdali pv. ulmi TaxID=251720 RepID=A0A3M4SZF1_PSEA0|nr:hypothetical protein ALP90_02257 [Pseudomonas amygdali pv. ulmi]